eukprot:251428_1
MNVDVDGSGNNIGDNQNNIGDSNNFGSNNNIGSNNHISDHTVNNNGSPVYVPPTIPHRDRRPHPPQHRHNHYKNDISPQQPLLNGSHYQPQNNNNPPIFDNHPPHQQYNDYHRSPAQPPSHSPYHLLFDNN